MRQTARWTLATTMAVALLTLAPPAASADPTARTHVIAKHEPCAEYPSPSGCRTANRLPGSPPDCWALNVVTARPLSAPRYRWLCVDIGTYRSHGIGSGL